ncbi:MAG: hypothetical protein AAFQ63_13925 [Cyanobacteria bacterium J06621_11]
MIEVQVNRASALFRQAADSFNQAQSAQSAQSEATELEQPAFSYWCKFYGENPDEREDSIKLIEPEIYNKLESKGSVSKLLKKHGIEDVFPATFMSVKEAIAYVKDTPKDTKNSVNIWFVKPFHLSGGRDIQVVSTAELPSFDLPKFNIIQAGIENIQLIEGKKFTARVYLLIWNKRVYLFDDGFALIHAPTYEAGSTDYSVQVDHRGYQTEKSAVEMKLMSDLPQFDGMMTQAKASLLQMMPVFEGAIAASSEKRYILLGLDFLLLKDDNIKFIEINAIPNFIHSKRTNQLLNVPFFEHTMRVIYGLGSDRFSALSV